MNSRGMIKLNITVQNRLLRSCSPVQPREGAAAGTEQLEDGQWRCAQNGVAPEGQRSRYRPLAAG